MSKTVKIAGVQGFYGDSPMGAVAVVMERAADYLVHDALAELTLSILQKDRMADPNMGYAKDIEILAKILYPAAFKQGMKVVTNSGGLNPEAATARVQSILQAQGVTGVKIATITGDDLLADLKDIQANGLALENMDTGLPLSSSTYQATHANVYIGAQKVKDALDAGADLILAGRVADPCLTLGILAHEFGWEIDDASTQEQLDKLASGIAVGHLLECGGQASGGNSYAEWPMDFPTSNLGYPIAEVSEDGSAVFTKLESQGGKMSRNTLREQLVYEIHDPANYITPDVIVDLTQATIEDIGANKVAFQGVKGKPRPEKLKLTIGLMEGYITEQFFFFSWPYAYEKAQKFIEAVKEIWKSLPVNIDKQQFDIIGVNAMHGSAAPELPQQVLDQLNEVGVRLAIRHQDARTGKIAMMGITGQGLNGPPGLISMPSWGKINRVMLSLWPTLVPREIVKEEMKIWEV